MTSIQYYTPCFSAKYRVWYDIQQHVAYTNKMAGAEPIHQAVITFIENILPCLAFHAFISQNTDCPDCITP